MLQGMSSLAVVNNKVKQGQGRLLLRIGRLGHQVLIKVLSFCSHGSLQDMYSWRSKRHECPTMQ